VTNADALVAEIRDGILDGNIRSGHFLGSERDISENFKVSRNTAREALRSLAALGAVEIKVGVKGGATIAEGDVDAIGETLAIQHCLSEIPEDEVLEIQSVLEGLAAERAAEHATPEDIERLEELLAGAEEEGVNIKMISLADTVGWATPRSIKQVVGAVRNRWPDKRICLHLHDTRGCGIANFYAGMELGVDLYDASVAGLGGCPFAGHKGAAGNICTEDMVFMAEELGIETGVDLEALIEALDFCQCSCV
jgi:Mn-dependent DtxR family transcriptional regulator